MSYTCEQLKQGSWADLMAGGREVLPFEKEVYGQMEIVWKTHYDLPSHNGII